MSTVTSARPKAILRGFKDESGVPTPVVDESLPTHLPHVFLFAEKGPLEPQLVVGGSMTRMYGASTFNLKGPYATHQTVLANIVNGKANQMIVQRLKPEDAAPPATLTLSLEVIRESLPVYERNSDGSVKIAADGTKIVVEGESVVGYKGRWIVSNINYGQGQVFGERVQQTGTLTSTLSDEESTVYPIMDLEVSDFGEHGNHKGIRLWAPTMRGTQPANLALVEDQKAYLYRLQMVERPRPTVQPNVVETLSGSQFVEFSFKEDAVNPVFDDAELYVGDILLDAYRNLDRKPLQFGPFNQLHVYQNFIETVLETLYNDEKAYHPFWPEDAEDGKHLMNIVGGSDIYGNAYHSFKLLNRVDGGVDLTQFSNHYAAGGNDGTMTFETFDALVANQASNYGDLEWKFLDTAYWPQSFIWDTGFTLETKRKLLVPIGRRDDIATILSTQDVSQAQNTVEQESSMAIALRAAARLYPESEIFGTPCCRAVVIGHSGKLLNSQWKDLTAMTVQVAEMVSSFMGAGDGIWATDRGFDTSPYNRVTMFKDVNATYKPDNVYDQDWDNGLVWVQNYDRNSLFFPAMQTVYDDNSSVLNSFINMAILIEVNKVCRRVWRQLTGGSKLTREQFIERSDELILAELDGRFDDRVIFVPRTYFTDFDKDLGYAWSTDVDTYLNNMMSVGTYTVKARRRADFV